MIYALDLGALVAGADLDEMLRNAGRARLVYEGMAFDRDGDPDNGAEFVVVICGDIMTMPGLPRVPAANNIELDTEGRITGLF